LQPLIVLHVLPEYRVPVVDALHELHPGTRVVVTDGGAWASSRNAVSVTSRPDVTVLRSRHLRIGRISVVLFPGLRSLVRESSADVLLLDPRMGFPSVWSLAAFPVRRSGVPIPSVWWFAGWRNRERAAWVSAAAEALQRAIIRRAAGAACYSTSARRLAVELGISDERAILAQNAIATEALVSAYESRLGTVEDSKAEALHLLYVGAVEGRKSLDSVLEAMASTRLRSLVLLRIVGSGPERGALESQTKALGLQEYVSFVEATHDPESLADHLAWADVGVLPNQGGLFLNTAMSCGVPVVCGAADGTELDLIVDGVTGWRLQDGSPAAIADKVADILVNRHTVATMGAAARHRYEHTATIDHMIAGIDTALRAALSPAVGSEHHQASGC